MEHQTRNQFRTHFLEHLDKLKDHVEKHPELFDHGVDPKSLKVMIQFKKKEGADENEITRAGAAADETHITLGCCHGGCGPHACP